MKYYILFILFLTSITFTSVQSQFDQDKYSYTIYPNPASTFFTIKFDNPAKVISVSIYSIIGNEVLNKRIDGNDKINFNVQNLRRGKYIIRILNNDGSTETQSLIIN